MAQKRDYYEVLGVERKADQDEIKRAFRDLAKQWHPDRNPNNKKEAEAKFKEIAEAFAILSDEKKRQQYDQFGHEGLQGMPGADFSGVSLDDLFASFFGGRGGSLFEDFFGGSGQGDSLRYELEITLPEAAKGVSKTIQFQRLELCATCGGSGARAGSKPKACSYCRGQGQVLRSQGFFALRTPCPQCGGHGSLIEKPCAACKGSGRELKKIRLEVAIPAGIETGTRIRLAGEGEVGQENGRRGDLFVIIRVREHEFFVRRGRDLLVEMPISFVTAALGGEIEAPTLEGNVRLTVPRGTQSGQLLRLRGRGLPEVHGFQRGDQFVRVVVETPGRLTPEQEELLRRFAATEQIPGNPHKRSFVDKLKNLFGEN